MILAYRGTQPRSHGYFSRTSRWLCDHDQLISHRLGRAGEALAWRWLRGIHNSAARTLAPSTVTAAGLHAQGIGNVWLWGRGVDTKRFHPARRSPELRQDRDITPESAPAWTSPT
jgi:hypothetical protein